jgi:hypothetical protein
MTTPVIVVEDYAALFRLFEAICHPETVEGWNDPDAILERAEADKLLADTWEPEQDCSDDRPSTQWREHGNY